MPVRKMINPQNLVVADCSEYFIQNGLAEMIDMNRYIQGIPVFFEKFETEWVYIGDLENQNAAGFQ